MNWVSGKLGQARFDLSCQRGSCEHGNSQWDLSRDSGSREEETPRAQREMFANVCQSLPVLARGGCPGFRPLQAPAPVMHIHNGRGQTSSIIHEVSRAFLTTWVIFARNPAGQEAAVMAVSGRAGLAEPFFWGAAPAAAGPGSSLLWDTWPCGRAGSREDFGVRGTLGVLPKRQGNFSRVPGAAERAGLGRIGPFSCAPAALRSEDGFTPVSPLHLFNCYSR